MKLTEIWNIFEIFGRFEKWFFIWVKNVMKPNFLMLQQVNMQIITHKIFRKLSKNLQTSIQKLGEFAFKKKHFSNFCDFSKFSWNSDFLNWEMNRNCDFVEFSRVFRAKCAQMPVFGKSTRTTWKQFVGATNAASQTITVLFMLQMLQMLFKCSFGLVFCLTISIFSNLLVDDPSDFIYFKWQLFN